MPPGGSTVRSSENYVYCAGMDKILTFFCIKNTTKCLQPPCLQCSVAGKRTRDPEREKDVNSGTRVRHPATEHWRQGPTTYDLRVPHDLLDLTLENLTLSTT